MSDSVQYIADHVGIHRSTVLRYTTTAELYLNRFLISYDPITEMDNSESMALDLFLDLLNNARNEQYLSTVQPNSKSILAVRSTQYGLIKFPLNFISPSRTN